MDRTCKDKHFMKYLYAVVVFCAASSGSAQTNHGGSRGADTIIPLETPVRAAALSQDGAKVACVGDDGVLRVFQTSDGSKLFQTASHEAPINAVAFSPDGNWVATGGALKSTLSDIRLPVGATSFKDAAQKFKDAAQKKGGRVIPMSEDGRGILPEEQIKAYKFGVVTKPFVGPSPVRIFEGGLVTIWDSSKGLVKGRLTAYDQPVVALAFSNKMASVFVVDKNFTIYHNDINIRKRLYYSENNYGIKFNVYPVSQTSFSLDGTRIASLAAAEGDQRIKLKLFDGEADRFSILDAAPPIPWTVAVSPDGAQFVTTGPGDDLLLLWDLKRRGYPVKSIKYNSNKCIDPLIATFNLEGDQILCCGRNQEIRLWDLRAGRCVLTAESPNRDIRAVAIGKDHVKVASGGFRSVGKKVEPLVISDYKFDVPVGNP
jgi:WD40 repeat protein